LTKKTIESTSLPTNTIQTIDYEIRPVLSDMTIVIPTLGRAILEQSLHRILAGNGWPARLIVVEQGASSDVSLWLGRVEQIGIPVTHIISNQRGRSAGINRGLEKVTTEYVAITDDDCFVREDWLFNMAASLRKNTNTVVTGRVEAAGEEMIIVVTSTRPAIQKSPRLNFDTMSGGNMGAPLAVFKEVGLFDEDPAMSTAEDAEWSYRALRKGIAIMYDPDVVVWHYGWRDVEKRAEQYYRYALSHGGFFGKYLRRGDLFILLRAVLHFMRALRRWLFGRVQKNPELALNGRAYCLGLFPGIRAGWGSRTSAGKLK
jgi:GT2 family glycosyltransferase